MFRHQAVPVISVRELADRLERGDAVTVIDVREPWELEQAQVQGALPIPLRELPRAVESLDPAQEYAVLCHHGSRSEMATVWLRNQGFERVSNIAGGIDAWSREVDPSVPQY